MKGSTLFLVFCFVFTCSIPRGGHPCTTFCIDNGDQVLFGKNFDWIGGEGLLIVNKQGVSKTALVNPEETGVSQPASWTSQYGSVTFTHLARDLPFGGINEAGLVVELMMLVETEYPEEDSRPYIGSLQWIQYQLDNFSMVEQVIASDSQVKD
jgi:choloylglycine hydrolase